jgi:hypothetical protein
MNTRAKFQVWSESFKQWRTVYVLPGMLLANMALMRAYGIKFRVGG